MKKVIYVVSCILLIIFLIHGAGHLVRPVDTDIALNAIQTFYDLPEDSVEVMVYGSSVAWRGIDIIEMYEKYGIGAYNFACNWQHINTTSIFLSESLKKQSPKVILIETYNINSILENTDINGEIYYTRGLKPSEEKTAYLRRCFAEDKSRWLSYYMPLYAFHDNWGNITAQSFRKDSSGVDLKKTMGYVQTDGVTSVTLGEPSAFPKAELSASAKLILDGIVKQCKENGIQIIFLTIPMQEGFAYGDAMEKYAKENGCAYLNLYEDMEEVGIDGSTDFFDVGHLNSKGAKKVAAYVGEYLTENYQLTDMRQMEDNIWERQLDE